MDWKTVITTFGILFLAELGDKTQLAVISMTSSSKKYLEVFIGASSALIVVTALGVLFGEALIKIVPQNVIHMSSAVLFILIGVLMLAGKF